MKVAMKANWWGITGKWLSTHVGRISKSEEISGIPGSPLDYHGVPYALTEEFVAVYRMHPLLPDEFTFRSLDDAVLSELTFPELNALHSRDRLGEITMPNALYSLGVSHPGAITLRNYPRFLQHFERPDGFLMDLAATDILRSRERGVPRYTTFRELLHMRPVRSFEELTDNPEWAESIRTLYNGEIHEVDLMVGLYAEPFPKGFGFSDTAFRIFILMASRRLKSDRFFTDDYRPEVYTQAGLDWIAENDMRSVLLRHFKQLEPALEGVKNPFAPWTRIEGRRPAPARQAAAAAPAEPS
jgi:Animal haem peroxidase